MEFIPTDSFVSPLKGFLVLSPATQKKKDGADITYSKLDDKPQRYVIGTMKKVNEKITDFKMGLQKFDSSDLVIEDSKRYSGQKRARQTSRPSKGAEKEGKTSVRLSEGIRLQIKTCQKKVTSEKDKLVELYQYPGYNKQELTPLPNGMKLEEIVEKVIRAQRRTPIGKPNPEIQGYLFDHIAENYACILLGSHRVSNQDNILKKRLLRRPVHQYSVQQNRELARSLFNTQEFKAQLCDVFSEWLGGMLHAPGKYHQWDYSQLEPERSRREDILSGKRKLGADDKDPFRASKSSGDSKRSSIYSSQIRKKTPPSRKAVSKPTEGLQKPSKASKNISQQASPSRESTYYHFQSTLQDDLFRRKDSLSKQRSTPKRRLKITYHHRESHPACRGPEFAWHLLNIGGCSPLVQHFLQTWNCEPKTGCDIFVTRREICKPLPLDQSKAELSFTLKITDSAETYADVIKRSFSILQQRKKAYKKAFWRHWKEMKNFDEQWKENQELFRQEEQEEIKKQKAQKKK